ncbi:hypothetical protein [Candidatus Thiodubiliella endoseptemdiera]
MNTKKKEKIAYKKERVVLSDILPYEVPAIFNNYITPKPQTTF